LLDRLDRSDPSLRGRTALLVDGVRDGFSLASALSGHQIQVLRAETGRECLNALQANPEVDLVILDLETSAMEGSHAVRAIRAEARWRTLPVIGLGLEAAGNDRAEWLAAGVSDGLAKPVDVDELVSAMRVHLGERGTDGA
jgi:DNA-binding response OmpR family regulator